MTSALWNELLNNSPVFNERLELTLELTIDGTVIKVWGANVKNFEMELLSFHLITSSLSDGEFGRGRVLGIWR